MKWWAADCRTSAPYQPNLSLLRSRFQRQPPDSSTVCVCGMWLRKSRRCGRRNQCFRAGTPLVSLWRGCVKCLDEARTHRRGEALRLSSRRNPLPLGRGGCQFFSPGQGSNAQLLALLRLTKLPSGHCLASMVHILTSVDGQASNSQFFSALRPTELPSGQILASLVQALITADGAGAALLLGLSTLEPPEQAANISVMDNVMKRVRKCIVLILKEVFLNWHSLTLTICYRRS